MAGRWTQYSGLGDVPFGAMWCVVPPGGRSHTDCHPERELVVVVQGAASVQAREQPVQMTYSGSGTYLAPPD